uniref:Uncharacterized protein n=1 Tax=Acrobeloides nanus TaxID=290746 RepID=A0A914EBX4_9BILA
MKSPSQSMFSHGCGRGTCRVPSQRPPSFTRDCANDPRTPLGQRRLSNESSQSTSPRQNRRCSSASNPQSPSTEKEVTPQEQCQNGQICHGESFEEQNESLLEAEQKRYMYAMQQDANSSEDLIHQEEDDQAAAPVSVKEIPSAATVPMSEVLPPTAGKEVQKVEKEVQTVENLLRKENEMPEPKRPSPDASTPRFNLYNNQRRFVNSQGRLSPPNKQPMSFPVADEEDYRHATRAHRDAPNSPFRRSANFNHMPFSASAHPAMFSQSMCGYPTFPAFGASAQYFAAPMPMTFNPYWPPMPFLTAQPNPFVPFQSSYVPMQMAFDSQLPPQGPGSPKKTYTPQRLSPKSMAGFQAQNHRVTGGFPMHSAAQGFLKVMMTLRASYHARTNQAFEEAAKARAERKINPDIPFPSSDLKYNPRDML